MSGYTLTQDELLYVLATPITKNTFTAQAPISAAASSSVPRCIIPANYFSQVGKSLKVHAAGSIANTAAATFVYAAGLDSAAGTIAGTGGGTLFTSPAQAPTASQTSVFDLDLDITATAVGNLGTTLQVNGTVRESVAATSVWSTAGRTMAFRNSLTGLNNEINLWLELFGTWSASSASNTTTLDQFKVYGEN